MRTLNSKLQMIELATWTKAELIEALAPVVHVDRSVLAKVGKTDLVEAAVKQVAAIKEAELLAAAEAEAKRQEVLAAEKASGRVAMMMAAIADNLQAVQERAQKDVDEFTKKVADGDVVGAMTWRGEGAMQAWHTLGWATNLHGFFAGEADQPTLTLEEVKGRIGEALEGAMVEVLDDSYRHNSTDAMSNIENMAKYRARQKRAAWLRSLATAMAKWDVTADTCEVRAFEYVGRF